MLYLINVTARTYSMVIQTVYYSSLFSSSMNRLIEHGPYWYFIANNTVFVYSNTAGVNYTLLASLTYTMNMGGLAVPTFSCSTDGIYLAMMVNYYYVNLYKLTGSSFALITSKDSGVSAVSRNGYWATNPYGQNIMNIYRVSGGTVNLFQSMPSCDCNYFFD